MKKIESSMKNHFYSGVKTRNEIPLQIRTSPTTTSHEESEGISTKLASFPNHDHQKTSKSISFQSFLPFSIRCNYILIPIIQSRLRVEEGKIDPEFLDVHIIENVARTLFSIRLSQDNKRKADTCKHAYLDLVSNQLNIVQSDKLSCQTSEPCFCICFNQHSLNQQGGGANL